jgi:hypothetical protein
MCRYPNLLILAGIWLTVRIIWLCDLAQWAETSWSLQLTTTFKGLTSNCNNVNLVSEVHVLTCFYY